jgi:hypothetical protein
MTGAVKRTNIDPRELRGAIIDCYRQADNAKSFAAALEERGLFLARGCRRGFVAVTMNGDVYSLSRILPDKTSEIAARLGDPVHLPSVAETQQRIASEIMPRLSGYIAEAKRIARHTMEPLAAKREALKVQHQAERQAFDQKIQARWDNEQRIRASRLRKGFAGAWDVLTGRYFKVRKQNEMEMTFARERDNTQRHTLVQSQLAARQALQDMIKESRRKEAERILSLYRDAAKFRRMRENVPTREPNGRVRDTRSRSAKPRERGLDLG